MIFKNAEIYNKDFERVKADIEVTDGIITAVAPCIDGPQALDCTGKVILPGFVDIHTHGALGHDITAGQPDAAAVMSQWLAQNGVTSFCPTSMTVDKALLFDSFRYVADTVGKEPGAYIHGINMEGPFISKAKKGAQAEENILPPDFALFDELNKTCPVRLVDVAPETDGALDFIRQAAKVCVVSAAHTQADYEMGMKAFDAGVTHITHLYNAMPPLLSRSPGLVGAAMDDSRVMAEIICDGIHIAPAVLRLTFKALGEDRTVVISDSIMAAGLTDGEYTLGGQKVFVKNGAATLADGTVAGSTTNLWTEFRNLLRYGIPEKQAVKSCSLNPAKSIGADSICGSLAPGKNADLLIVSADLSAIEQVYIKGKKVV